MLEKDREERRLYELENRIAALEAAVFGKGSPVEPPYTFDPQKGVVTLANVKIDRATISDLQVERSAPAVNEDDILAEPATAVTTIDAQVGDRTLGVTAGLPLSAHLGLCWVESEMALSVDAVSDQPRRSAESAPIIEERSARANFPSIVQGQI
ncbi:hypothetical protein ACQKGC_05925 [Allorhizobium pseudoryzae]|uniref:hypothetical protein n=1 Tax=Allorhizobium pseudoryzae TaxID=379684 RepID=UPI003D03D8A9